MTQPTTHTLPVELRFPKPPFRIHNSLADSASLGPEISAYVGHVVQWRSVVLEMFDESHDAPFEIKDLSDRARQALKTFLASG